jgi:hypothetical protein
MRYVARCRGDWWRQALTPRSMGAIRRPSCTHRLLDGATVTIRPIRRTTAAATDFLAALSGKRNSRFQHG